MSRTILLLPLLSLLACGGDGSGPNFQDDHPRIYLSANRERLVASLEANGAAAARYKESVDLQLGGADLYAFEAWSAALLGQLTGEPQYCRYAVDKIDAEVASEEVLIDSGMHPEVARDSYLYVGPTINDVMLTYDWCFDTATSSQKARWLKYAHDTVFNVWHPAEAVWGGVDASWSGWATDNPNNNYWYSFLRATMSFALAAHDEDEYATECLDFARTTLIMMGLIPTLEELPGGGSLEGTGYGVSMWHLFEMYDFWESSTGEDLAHLTPHSRASLLQMLHEIVPTRDRVAPTGDHSRDSSASLFDYHHGYIEILSYLLRDDPLAARGKWFNAHSSVPQMGETALSVYDFMYEIPDVEEQPLDGLNTVYYASGIGQTYMRSSWDTDATWVNLLAGPYTQDHAHQDQGSLLFYRGEWLAYDANIDSHSGIRWTNEQHNLVRILDDAGETVPQHQYNTSDVLALAQGDGYVHVAVDTTAVYDDDPRVTSVQREVVYLEPDVVVVFDRVTTAEGTAQNWQLNSPLDPVISGTRTTFTGDVHTLRIERVQSPTVDAAARDWSQLDDDFKAGHRLDETAAGGTNTFLHVLWTDDAATAVVRDDADGRIGTTITLAGGGTATVRFSTTGVDGTLDLDGTQVTLGTGVAVLPEMR